MILSFLVALVSFVAIAVIFSRNRHLADEVEILSAQDWPTDSIEEKVGALGTQAAHATSIGFLVLLKNFSGFLARILSLVEKKLHEIVNRLVGRNKGSGDERGIASFFLRHIAEHKKSLDRK